MQGAVQKKPGSHMCARVRTRTYARVTKFSLLCQASPLELPRAKEIGIDMDRSLGLMLVALLALLVIAYNVVPYLPLGR